MLATHRSGSAKGSSRSTVTGAPRAEARPASDRGAERRSRCRATSPLPGMGSDADGSVRRDHWARVRGRSPGLRGLRSGHERSPCVSASAPALSPPSTDPRCDPVPQRPRSDPGCSLSDSGEDLGEDAIVRRACGVHPADGAIQSRRTARPRSLGWGLLNSAGLNQRVEMESNRVGVRINLFRDVGDAQGLLRCAEAS